MRLFIAVDLDEHARAVCEAKARELAARIREAVPSADVKWVPAENRHITLRFIGQVGDPLAASIADAMALPLPVAPFDVRLDGIGVFPGSGPPRVIWIGFAEGQEALRAVHAEVERRLDRFELPREERAFTAHLTLARFRTPARGSGAAIRQALRSVAPADVRWSVNRVTLYESRLSPKGSTYRPLAHAPLSGRQD